MRNFILGFSSLVLLLMIILISTTVYGRSARKAELDMAMNSSMEYALESIDQNRALAPSTEEELVAIFMESFVQQINSKSDVMVEILNVDIDKRLLSVKATLKYNHLNGRLGQISLTKTLVTEQFAADTDFIIISYVWNVTDSANTYKTNCTTTYYVNNNEKIKICDSSKKYLLESVLSKTATTSDESEESAVSSLKSITMQDAGGQNVVLNVGTAYDASYLESLTVINAKDYSSITFSEK